MRGTSDGLAGSISITLNAALIFAFAGLAWRAVRRKDISTHQQWATRLFLVVNGVWFLRVGLMAWGIATERAFGMETFFSIWQFGSYLLPLAIYELYLRAKQSADAPAKFAMAGSLFTLTLLMGAGIAGAFMFLWRPLL